MIDQAVVETFHRGGDVVAPIRSRQHGQRQEDLVRGCAVHRGQPGPEVVELLDIDALEWIRDYLARGAGEILLTSWDRDGTRAGYDLDLLSAAAAAAKGPIIASGAVPTTSISGSEERILLSARRATAESSMISTFAGGLMWVAAQSTAGESAAVLLLKADNRHPGG